MNDDDELLKEPEAAKILKMSPRSLARIPEEQLERVYINRLKFYRRGAIRDLIRRSAKGGGVTAEA